VKAPWDLPKGPKLHQVGQFSIGHPGHFLIGGNTIMRARSFLLTYGFEWVPCGRTP
jgi:hypothetical protein